MINKDLAAAIGAAPPPPSFILDASVLENRNADAEQRNTVKQNNIIFEFPEGFAKVDIREECRALCDLENFDTMYDLTMMMLDHKFLTIKIRDEDGNVTVLDEVLITNYQFDLRTVPIIDECPWIVNWLVEFVAAYLGKRFPMPTTPPAGASESQAVSGKK
jgi:hypothetical protein